MCKNGKHFYPPLKSRFALWGLLSTVILVSYVYKTFECFPFLHKGGEVSFQWIVAFFNVSIFVSEIVRLVACVLELADSVTDMVTLHMSCMTNNKQEH